MLSYYLFRIFETFFLALPYALQKAIVLGLAKLAFLIDSKHKKIIQANLDLTLKDTITSEQRKRVLHYCHKNLALVLLQVLRASRLRISDLEKIVTFKNKEIVDQALAEGKPIIFISAHYGNWEIGATALSALVTPTLSVHKKMNNPYFDDYLMRSRTTFNMEMAEKRGAIKHLIKALKKGKSVGILVDQNVNPKDGVIIDFLGAKATQSPAPAFLSRKLDLKIIPLLIHTAPGEENTITFYDPIVAPKTEDEQADILACTQAQADLVGNIIANHPEPWFWCHKRWKSTHEEIYK